MYTTMIGVGPVSVEMHDDGDAIVRMTHNGKAWEPETRRYWSELMHAGKLVLDIGAYTGIYSIASALMGFKVIALEPHPANFARLKLNAAINSVKMKLLMVAASDRVGHVMLHAKKPVTVISDTASLEQGDPDCLIVQAMPVDDILIEQDVGLIKIDVEHHERSVLIGATKTINKHKPAILIELLDAGAVAHTKIWLGALGFRHRGALDARNHLFQW